MSNLNQVVLQGNLTDNPKIVGNDDNKVARFSIAVNNGVGEKRETAFVDCVAFGNQVPVIQKFLVKGKQVLVSGRLIQSNWQDKDGNKRSKLELRLNNVGGFFFTGKPENESDGESQAKVASSEDTKLF